MLTNNKTLVIRNDYSEHVILKLHSNSNLRFALKIDTYVINFKNLSVNSVIYSFQNSTIDFFNL